MASPLKSASPQEPLSTSTMSLPPLLLSSKDTHPADLHPESNSNDTDLPAAAEAPQPLCDTENQAPARSGIPTAISRRLYLSHFLSTWNSRSFEFGAVLFLASIFTGTLLPLSIYALVRSVSAIIFAPMIGRAIDRRDRLHVVRFSIGKLPTSASRSTSCNIHGIRKTTTELSAY
jgi:hypothetical protein